MGSVVISQQRMKRCVPDLKICLPGVVTPARDGWLWLYRHTQKKPWRTIVKRNSSRGKNVDSMLTHGQWLTGWPADQRLGKNTFSRRSGGKASRWSSQNGHRVRIDTHQRTSTMEGALACRVDKMTYSEDVSLFPPLPQCLLNGSTSKWPRRQEWRLRRGSATQTSLSLADLVSIMAESPPCHQQGPTLSS